ncbi:glycerophosphodiester phosphodiesterase family protein [Rothia kristinae]|uniref:glycerophosphodiester phosphodiesterase family protein n=1 Tax=Rothia kristinae TaxID=37923 RepID=UPI0021A78E06|nr:glycerophosphodiester phosphodiesterase family protein [Rothia kristinae]MCT1356853.1 hypothetical protein [Rothia kristinae]MCT1392602.1 hypothetical protein [Rothia kristinae]MCT1506602.1 hypothetical protein [Rothia kristinae]MCT2037671.1 hypothetical protein [Rothia kristinae]MCT2244249.1 hypothetical protein [Rothia kristinae]
MSERPRDRTVPTVYAHRGLALEAAENSLEAFRAAVEAGAEWIETDVNTTADGVVLVLHDPSLDRVAGVPGRVSQLSAAQVAEVRLPDGQRIPTLAEALEAFPTARFNIDLKDEGAVEAVPRVLREAGAVDRVRIASFSDARRRRALAALRASGAGTGGPRRSAAGTTAGPFGQGARHGIASGDGAETPGATARRGIDSGDDAEVSGAASGASVPEQRRAPLPPSSPGIAGTALFLLVSRLPMRWVRPGWRIALRLLGRWVPPFDALQVPESHRLGPVRVPVVTRRFLHAAHACGLRVDVWTVDDPENMRRLAALGVDGLVTNRADLARKLFPRP